MVKYCGQFHMFKMLNINPSCNSNLPYFTCYDSKVSERFSLTSSLIVTTHVAVTYSWAIFFLSVSLNLDKILSPHLHVKVILSLKCGNFLPAVLISLALKSSEVLPN